MSGLISASGFIAAVLTVAACFGRLVWIFELATHFRAHYALALLVATLAAIVRWQLRWSVVLGLLAGFNAAAVFPSYVTQLEIPAPNASPLRVAVINLSSSNDDASAVLAFVEHSAPDVVALLEVTPDWERNLEPLTTTLTHTHFASRRDDFGLAVASRTPLWSADVVRLDDSGIPSIHATVETPAGPIQLWVTHPLPPISPSYARSRNRQLAALATSVAHAPEPVVILGDLNASPWSPAFRDLLAMGRLEDSRQGFGIQASWPTWLGPLGIPIDHVLVRDAQVVRRRIGPNVGSDHFPVIVDLWVSPRDTPVVRASLE